GERVRVARIDQQRPDTLAGKSRLELEDGCGAGQVARETTRGGRGNVAEDQREVLAERLHAGVHPGEAETLRHLHGRKPCSVERPRVSSKPHMRLRFWMA